MNATISTVSKYRKTRTSNDVDWCGHFGKLSMTYLITCITAWFQHFSIVTFAVNFIIMNTVSQVNEWLIAYRACKTFWMPQHLSGRKQINLFIDVQFQFMCACTMGKVVEWDRNFRPTWEIARDVLVNWNTVQFSCVFNIYYYFNDCTRTVLNRNCVCVCVY